MASIRVRHQLLWCSVLAAAGCGSSDPGDLGRCDPLTVASVVTPPAVEFSWEPADCDASTLTVFYQNEAQWTLITTPQTENRLRSPIRYGVVPQGATASGAAPLLSGQRYTLDIFRVEQEGRFVYAQHEFEVP